MTADRPATEPRTEAGRRLLRDPRGPNLSERILAIEAEAAQEAAPRAEGLPPRPDELDDDDLVALLTLFEGESHRRFGPAAPAEGLPPLEDLAAAICYADNLRLNHSMPFDAPCKPHQYVAERLIARLSRPSDEKEES